LVVVLLVLYKLPVLVRGQFLLLVLLGKELVALMVGVLLQVLVLVGERPLLPVHG
jgi:hypothetical protein